MPDIGELITIQQGSVHISSVQSGTVHPAQIQIATVEYTADTYTGATTFTPSAETQVVPIIGKIAESNITINPIPSNYGLITYSGNIITVS